MVVAMMGFVSGLGNTAIEYCKHRDRNKDRLSVQTDCLDTNGNASSANHGAGMNENPQHRLPLASSKRRYYGGINIGRQDSDKHLKRRTQLMMMEQQKRRQQQQQQQAPDAHLDSSGVCSSWLLSLEGQQQQQQSPHSSRRGWCCLFFVGKGDQHKHSIRMKGIALVFLLLVVVWLVFAWTLLVWGVAAEYNGVFAATNPNGSVGGSSNINNKQNYLLEDDPTDDGNDSAHRDLAESIRILRTRRQELEEQAPQIELEELAPQIEELEKLLDGNHLNNDNRFAPSDIETREELRLARLEQKIQRKQTERIRQEFLWMHGDERKEGDGEQPEIDPHYPSSQETAQQQQQQRQRQQPDDARNQEDDPDKLLAESISRLQHWNESGTVAE
eukprot:jgi/Psemu1/20251/gm1.20251_g